MNIFRDIFYRIWAVWALLLFVVTMIIFLIPFFLFSYFKDEPLKTIRFNIYARVWMGFYLFMIGCPLTVRGRGNFKAGENYIVLCNHNTLMDVPVSYPAIPGGNKTIAKIEMAKIPLFGPLYKTGSVLVDRKSDASRKESYNKMKNVLAMGLHMCIYPEGTRNKTDQALKSFHSGAFRLAIETGKSIIPGVIFNTKKVLPHNKPYAVVPHPLEIHFLEPVKILAEDSVPGLQEKVFGIMFDYYQKNQK
ncbi:MAG: 1-acyl-sn-glycerol-3-phosphate acyltransferase [Chitinophagaceae bacterium]|nr:1-acyl-sn-glycerol-3-phosphate acyltransferase [Chitinophagaceae bacterium]